MPEYTQQTIAAYEMKNALLLEQAIQALANDLATTPELVADLKARIAENPAEWIMGRDDAPCSWCNETGRENRWSDLAKAMLSEPCRRCHGTKRSQEWPLHHGFGTGVRNRLRTLGFTEAVMGFGNWDDYYIDVLERAVERL